jgi:RNA polymerase sigma-70 factor (ECF subfamily)
VAVDKRWFAGIAELDDAEIVQRLRQRDECIFTALVRTWSPIMLRVAMGYLSSRASGEEVVQETWLAVVRGIDGFEGRSSLRTWALRICSNIARRHGVKDNRLQPVGLPGGDDCPSVDPGRFRPSDDRYPGGWLPGREPVAWGPEAFVVTAETRQQLIAALRQLPPRQAQVVALRDVHGLDGAEVPALLDISEGNVRVLLHRGRAALRQRLEDYYRQEVTG